MSRPRQFAILCIERKQRLTVQTLDISSARHRIGALTREKLPEYHEYVSDKFWWTGVT